MEEYELAKRGLQSDKIPSNSTKELDESPSLLQRRDAFIAQRIHETLLPGETGVIFLGMLHSLEPWLVKDIHVTYPLKKPFDV